MSEPTSQLAMQLINSSGIQAVNRQINLFCWRIYSFS